MVFAITGATGQYGQLVVRSLLERGVPPEEILACGRNATRLGLLAESGVRTAEVDHGDPARLRTVLDGADAVLLVSGSEPGVRVGEHENVISAAVAAGAGFLAYTSILRADTNPLMLAPDHRETERLVRESGLAFTLLRHGWYSENYVQPVRDAIAAGVLRSATGDGRVASASRADLAEAAAIVLTGRGRDGEAVELAGDTAWDFAQLAVVAGEISGDPVAYEALSVEELRQTLLSFGLDPGLVGFLVELDAQIGEGYLDSASTDLAEILGRPTETVATTLAREIGRTDDGR